MYNESKIIALIIGNLVLICIIAGPVALFTTDVNSGYTVKCLAILWNCNFTIYTLFGSKMYSMRSQTMKTGMDVEQINIPGGAKRMTSVVSVPSTGTRRGSAAAFKNTEEYIEHLLQKIGKLEVLAKLPEGSGEASRMSSSKVNNHSKANAVVVSYPPSSEEELKKSLEAFREKKKEATLRRESINK